MQKGSSKNANRKIRAWKKVSGRIQRGSQEKQRVNLENVKRKLGKAETWRMQTESSEKAKRNLRDGKRTLGRSKLKKKEVQRK